MTSAPVMALFESPRHGLDEGLERLLEVLSEPQPTLQEACDHVLDLLVDDRTRDDIALVIARTRALDHRRTVAWELLEDLSEVARARSGFAATGSLGAAGSDIPRGTRSQRAGYQRHPLRQPAPYSCA